MFQKSQILTRYKFSLVENRIYNVSGNTGLSHRKTRHEYQSLNRAESHFVESLAFNGTSHFSEYHQHYQ